MPTGYTSDLYDGKYQSFPEFAMECARNFGALITMRDADPGTPIPETFEPSNHHSKALTEAKQQRKWLVTADPAECANRAIADAKAWEAARAREEAIRVARKDRYEVMLTEVLSWIPPTHKHQGLKDFMVQQLTESINFDCSTYEFPSPTRDGEEWRQAAISKADYDIKYHSDEFIKEVERASDRSEWVRALRGSLA